MILLKYPVGTKSLTGSLEPQHTLRDEPWLWLIICLEPSRSRMKNEGRISRLVSVGSKKVSVDLFCRIKLD